MLVGEGDLPYIVDKLQVKIIWLADLERKGAKEQVEAPAIRMTPDLFVLLYCIEGSFRASGRLLSVLLSWSQQRAKGHSTHSSGY